ncbi:MAG: ABC transporter permease subunit, partial [Aestuariivirga sp.]
MSGFEYFLQQVINAISLGGLYALVAVGLSIVFGVLKLTNFAHGDVMMVGAFTTVILIGFGVPFVPALIGGIVGAGIAGFLIERIAYRPIRNAPDVTRLLT